MKMPWPTKMIWTVAGGMVWLWAVAGLAAPESPNRSQDANVSAQKAGGKPSSPASEPSTDKARWEKADSSVGAGSSSGRAGNASGGSASRSIRVWGDVGVHPVDRQAACQEAEQNALDSLYEELGQWARQLAGPKLSYRRLVVEHAWLLDQPGVQQSQSMQVEEKSHGWTARQEITLTVPTPVLARWADRLQQQHRQRTHWLAGGAAATVLGWLVGFLLMVRLDRATGGYYRAGVVLLMLAILVVLTGLAWWWLATTVW